MSTDQPADIFRRRTRADQLTRQHIAGSAGNIFAQIGIDLIVGRREGCFVWDLDGRRYLDVLCDGTTYNFGHRHPEILAAARDALDEIDIGCQFLVSEARAQLGEKLIAAAPRGLRSLNPST